MNEERVTEAYKEPIPYFVYERTMARFERTIKRLIIVIVIAVVALFASNMAWLYEWNQYDYSDVIMDNLDGGNANYLGAGASGVINNGTAKGENED